MQGKLLARESIKGQVICIGDGEIVVRYVTEDDVFEENYEIDQFSEPPSLGAYLEITTYVCLI